MPIYEYECWNCEAKVEEYRKLEDRLNGPPCPKCAYKMIWVLSLGSKPTDHLYPYMEENFEHKPVEIKSLKHYREEQKKRGLVDNGKPRGVRGQWI